MPTPICLVFPQQLFEQHPAFAAVSTFWFIEDDLLFLQLPFHRKKLAFHRASMSYYAENMRSNGKDVQYFKHNEAQLSAIFEKLKQCASQVHVVDPTDYLLEKRIRRFAQQYGLELIWHDNPSFLNSRSDNDLLLGKQTQRFFLADF